MVIYKAYISNCPILGETMGKVEGKLILNEIKLHLGNYDLNIIEEPQIVLNNFGKFKGQPVHTTDLLIEDIPESEFNDAEELSTEVASLLSLATCSMVSKFGYEFGAERTEYSIFGQLLYFRPLLDTKNGSLIRRFLEGAWPVYHSLKVSRKLNIAFQYFVWSQLNEQPIELSLVTTFVLYENLKHTFAIQQGYPFIREFFRPHGATTPNTRTKGFKELLREMFNTVGMVPNLDGIISLRNELVHSGISNLNLHEYIDIYSDCHDILREYLLKVLKYKGPYFPYSSPNQPIVI